MKNISNYIVLKNLSIRTALSMMDSNPIKILFVVDENGFLIGSLTDGDIRRWIISNGSINCEVVNTCNRNPVKASINSNKSHLPTKLSQMRLSGIPIVDSNNKIVDIAFNDINYNYNKSLSHRKPIKLDIPVVIMAGGLGTRLDPFTKILPKPLIPIGDKTILELIIEKFLIYDINNFFISVNHKSKIIKSYFEELNPEYNIKLIKEDYPLGTIGALSLMKGFFSKPILITNCDIIIDIDICDFYNFHIDNKFDISLVASLMNFKIPYGICDIGSGGILENLKEKPELSYLASTGMYIINDNLLDLIPDKELFHITQLIEKVKSNGGKIGVYPISEQSWQDTGNWAEYKKTIEKYNI